MADLKQVAPEQNLLKITQQLSNDLSIKSSSLNNKLNIKKLNNKNKSEKQILTKNKAQIIEKENIETGKVKMNVYLSYIKATSYFICITFIILYIISSFLGILTNLWLADWSDHAIEIQSMNNTFETKKRLIIYTSFGLGQGLIIFIFYLI